MSFLRLLLFTFALSPLSLQSSHAKTVTRYIDDTYGDLVTGMKPSYYPSGNTIWQDQSCGTAQGCRIVLDTNLSYNGTYTAATYQTRMDSMGITLNFRGTSIAVYFILANDGYLPSTTTLTKCNFILNEVVEKPYYHETVKGRGPQYNVEVFKKEGLQDQAHTLKIDTRENYQRHRVEEPDGDTDNRNGTTTASPFDSESDSKSSSPTGAIVGGVIGGLAFIGGVLAASLLCRGRNNAKVKQDGHNIHVTPYMVQVQPQHGGEFNSYIALGSRSSGIPTDAHLQMYPAHSTTDKASLMQRQQQLDRMREELMTLESSRGGHSHAPQSNTGTIRSGLTGMEGEMAELMEHIRELQTRTRMPPTHQQQAGQEVVDTPPPRYTS
ncbi:hypothetical protein PM082_006711 [Marasmius tenuissimus]|nr:hypothetical protein PM082_006711 [Marasmius tenuissimus]